MPHNIVSKSELMDLLSVYFKSFFAWLSQIVDYVAEKLPDSPAEDFLQIFNNGEKFRAEFIAFALQTISDRMDDKDEDMPLFTLRDECAFILEYLFSSVISNTPRGSLTSLSTLIPFIRIIAAIPDSTPSVSLANLLYFGQATRREIATIEMTVSDIAISIPTPVTDIFILQGARDEMTRRRISRQGYMYMSNELIEMIFKKPLEIRSVLIALYLAQTSILLGGMSTYAEAERRVDSEVLPRYSTYAEIARGAVMDFLSKERKRIYGS